MIHDSHAVVSLPIAEVPFQEDRIMWSSWRVRCRGQWLLSAMLQKLLSATSVNQRPWPIAVCRIGLSLCLATSCGSQWCWGASRIFTLDPTRSSLTITGYVTSTSVTLSAQVSGSNTASYFGSVNSSVDATGITFGGGSSITANNFSGTGLVPDSTANYGLVAKEFGIITAAQATVVNLKFDATSAVLPIASNGTFTVNSAVTATATTGAFDYIQTLPTSGSGTDNVAGDTASDQSTSSGSLSLSGQTQTLTIPVKATIVFTVSTSNDSAVTFTGQFVATSTIPTPPIAYWTGNVNANWNAVNQAANATNWATDATGAADADYFPGSPTDVFFTTSSHGANLGTTLAADFSIKGLTFTSDATSAVTIGGTNKLTLGVDGITVQSGAAAPVINAPVTLGSAQNWTIDGANPLTVNGSLSTAGFALTKMGIGTLTLGGVPDLASSTTLNVGAGTLILRVTGAPTIGSGVTASVSSGATLQLAGTVSALSNGTARVNVTNSSTAAGTGIVVSGTNQVVGAIDGLGSTQVNAGSDLTANHIIQNALIIGGTAGNPSLVTIEASDASGNPLDQSSGFALAGLLTPSEPFAAVETISADLSSSGGDLAAHAPSNSAAGGNPSAVPEPSTLVLVLLAIAGVIGQGIALRRRDH